MIKENQGVIFSVPEEIMHDVILELKSAGYRNRSWRLSYSFETDQKNHILIEILLNNHELLSFLKLKYCQYFIRNF